LNITKGELPYKHPTNIYK